MTGLRAGRLADLSDNRVEDFHYSCAISGQDIFRSGEQSLEVGELNTGSS